MKTSASNSSNSSNENKSGEKSSRIKTIKGKTTTQIMHKHIQDINDVISDEDFKNLELNLDNPLPSGTSHTPTIEDDNDRPKDEDKDHTISTPWDVIS